MLLILLATLYPNLDTHFGWSLINESVELIKYEIEEEESVLEEYLSLTLECNTQFRCKEAINNLCLFYSDFYLSDYLSQVFRPPIEI
jgi:hypothetical protein